MVINGHYHERSGRPRAAGAPGGLHHPALRHPVVVRKLPEDRWLRCPAQDPRREDPAGAGHRDGQGLGPARPRWRRLPARPEVVLHAQGQHAEVHPLQLGRIRAGHLQGPRHPALQSAHRD
ncbi:hypothetical protein G6F50_015714 [Rhizopus delemar]|uniref:Uncharacterized protein n=1 Tax=Rhizopus delemar TaxID=936053 RepID=A0A9P7C2T7_9FUNG|nr:hypothetical protein G6F50_015714 [Rhizopus delemar]